MKNFFILLIFLFIIILPVKADVFVFSSKQIQYYGIGVLNMPSTYNIYEYPDKNAPVILTANIEKEKQSAIVRRNDKSPIHYITYIPSKNIALLTVEENNGDGWYSVYINQNTGAIGWVYTDDSQAFLTYKSLFYKYGKKYGVKLFNDLPENKKILYSKSSTDSKPLDEISFPRFITFTVIQGNWMLVTVNNLQNQAKIGWFNWRNDDGSLNMFPNFKNSF